MAVQRFRLTAVDRTIIELRRRDGCSIRLIARKPGRSSGTVCDEIKQHGKVAGYRAATAEADAAASRPHSTGNGSISPGSVILAGCRPSRIASTMSGARSVNRSSFETSDELIFSAAASSSIVP